MQSENAVLVIIVIVETFPIACHLIALQTRNLSPSKKTPSHEVHAIDRNSFPNSFRTHSTPISGTRLMAALANWNSSSLAPGNNIFSLKDEISRITNRLRFLGLGGFVNELVILSFGVY